MPLSGRPHLQASGNSWVRRWMISWHLSFHHRHQSRQLLSFMKRTAAQTSAVAISTLPSGLRSRVPGGVEKLRMYAERNPQNKAAGMRPPTALLTSPRPCRASQGIGRVVELAQRSKAGLARLGKLALSRRLFCGYLRQLRPSECP